MDVGLMNRFTVTSGNIYTKCHLENRNKNKNKNKKNSQGDEREYDEYSSRNLNNKDHAEIGKESKNTS